MECYFALCTVICKSFCATTVGIIPGQVTSVTLTSRLTRDFRDCVPHDTSFPGPLPFRLTLDFLYITQHIGFSEHEVRQIEFSINVHYFFAIAISKNLI